MLSLLAQKGYQEVLGQSISTLNPKMRLGPIRYIQYKIIIDIILYCDRWPEHLLHVG